VGEDLEDMATTTALKAIELKPRVGSELRIGKDDLLSGDHADEIKDLLVQRGVLIIRDMPMSDDEHRRFTSSLGDLRLGTVKKEGDAGLMKVTMDKNVNPEYAQFFPGTFFWHMDGTYDELPPFATVLRPAVLSREGGQTEFANTYAAYEALSDEDKALVEKLSAVHTMEAAMWPSYDEVTVEQFMLWNSYPHRVHPLVWHHRSGRKSLVLSTSAARIVGLHPAESHDLLTRLMAHATQPEFVYRHSWQMNDLLMWDNTGTMHRVRPYPADSGRELQRFTLNGEEPVRAAA
jgi:alpha-ketoglutarate-dependent taurine dioxygenase